MLLLTACSLYVHVYFYPDTYTCTHALAHTHNTCIYTHTHTEEEYCPKSGEESDENDSCSSGVEEGAKETLPTSDDDEENDVTPAKKVKRF